MKIAGGIVIPIRKIRNHNAIIIANAESSKLAMAFYDIYHFLQFVPSIGFEPMGP